MAKAATVGQAAAGAGRTARGHGSRTPVERLLPPTVVSELRSAARSMGKITPQVVDQLNTRFEITERFGVTRARLRNFLAKVLTERDQEAPRERGAGAAWASRVRDHRRRQASIASILDSTFGRLAECSPDLWERRAYLLLVGLTYERLAADEGTLATEELVTLANVLAKLRVGAGGGHTNGKARSSPRGGSRGDGGTGRLPKRFAEVVREVYGADFQTP